MQLWQDAVAREGLAPPVQKIVQPPCFDDALATARRSNWPRLWNLAAAGEFWRGG